jgi:hypothetical protein
MYRTGLSFSKLGVYLGLFCVATPKKMHTFYEAVESEQKEMWWILIIHGLNGKT